MSAIEVLDGIKKQMSIYLTNEESHKFSLHLDKNRDGQITYDEFNSKIKLADDY